MQDLPLDILKIDKAFVHEVATDPRRAAVAQAIVRLGKTLGLRLVAEGVEYRAQADRLRAMGCDFAQGYYFSRPVEAEEIMRMLHADRRVAVETLTDVTPPFDAPPDRSVVMLPVGDGRRLKTRVGSTRRSLG